MYKRLLILFICFILFNSFILPLPKIPVRSFTKEDDGVVFKMCCQMVNEILWIK